MPASSMASSLGWAAYLAASLTLCVALAPTLSVLSSSSRNAAAIRAVDGVAAIIDELKPGVTASFAYSSQDFPGQLLLGGHSIGISAGNWSISEEVPWILPVMALTPGREYTVSLMGDSVEVTSGGGG